MSSTESNGRKIQVDQIFRWWFVATCLSLVAATWRLWLPGAAWPQVPWFAWGVSVPRAVDYCLLAMCGHGLLLLMFLQEERWKLGTTLFLMGWSGLLLLDQNRVQPWAVQLWWIALIFRSAAVSRWLGYLLLILMVIYFYSALSKLDHAFCTGLGRQFLGVLLPESAHPLVDRWPWLPLVFPLGELLLLWLWWRPATRPWGFYGLWVQHAVILWILGPWGLNHQPGVLVWNVSLIALLGIFYGERQGYWDHPQLPQEQNNESNRGVLISLWLIVWPLLEPYGLCDHWLAWGLYAGHGERLVVYLAPEAVERLSEPQLRFVREETDARGETRYRWRIDAAILVEQRVPYYPQNRVLAGLAIGLADRWGIAPNELSARWESRARRFTGARQSEFLPDQTALEQRAARCWFNTQPR